MGAVDDDDDAFFLSMFVGEIGPGGGISTTQFRFRFFMNGFETKLGVGWDDVGNMISDI